MKLSAITLAALAVSVSAATPARPALRVRGAPLDAASIEESAPIIKATKPKGFLQASVGDMLSKVDVPLLTYFFFWYVGNYYYTLSNKRALVAGGGKNGYPMTISTLQLGVGVLYALFAWVAPDMRAAPSVTMDDIVKMLPVGFCAAAAHSFSVFAQSAGAVSFAMIVKAAEPAFAAVIGTTLYGKVLSQAKWLCLIPVIGGVCLASVKELDFAWSALITASCANLFAAFKANENKKLMVSGICGSGTGRQRHGAAAARGGSGSDNGSDNGSGSGSDNGSGSGSSGGPVRSHLSLSLVTRTRLLSPH